MTASVRKPGRTPRPPVVKPGGRPDLRVEKALLRSGVTRIAAMDEVGRGALAGPVSVGVVVVTEAIGRVPAGLKDSKLLTPAARAALVHPVRRWAREYAVGHATPDEIDAWGIIAALRAAARRALAGLDGPVDAVLLDGSFDYLTERAAADPEPSLFDALADDPGTAEEFAADEVGTARPARDDVLGDVPAGPAADARVFGGLAWTAGASVEPAALGLVAPPAGEVLGPRGPAAARPAAVPFVREQPGAFPPCPQPIPLPVHVRIKADLTCAGVAGASVLAKTERDRMLVELDGDHPVYGFAVNKGYGTAEHVAALRQHGVSPVHRCSWRLPGVFPDGWSRMGSQSVGQEGYGRAR